MTKKRSSEIFGVETEFFSENSSFKNCSVPQTRRQISAYIWKEEPLS